MVIKKHPEWSDKYPAVDGIEYNTTKEMEELKKKYSGEFFGDNRFKRPIRSDIEKILSLNDEDFLKWFSDRKNIAQRLLKEYEVIATIPCLTYGFEDQQYDMRDSTHLNSTIGVLKNSIEYLDIIKQVRDESKKGE